jgi:tRNA A-37 threonylcarbamoyl transferase component Bud32
MNKLVGKKIGSGLESDVYMLRIGIYNNNLYDVNKQYVIKIFNKKNNIVNILNEFMNQNLAAKHGLAPKAIEYTDKYITMECIYGVILQTIIDEEQEQEQEQEQDYGTYTYVKNPIINNAIIEAIDKLHKLHIYHGDLSSMNTIIGANVYLIDFSFSRYDIQYTKEYLDNNDQFISFG